MKVVKTILEILLILAIGLVIVIGTVESLMRMSIVVSVMMLIGMFCCTVTLAIITSFLLCSYYDEKEQLEGKEWDLEK